MKINTFFPWSFLCLALATECDAWPGYAGTCASGKSIGSSSYGSHGATGKGSLDNDSLMLSIENDDVLEFKLSDQTTTVLDTTSYSVTLKGETNSNVSYRGFLIRLQAMSFQDISTTLTPISSNAQPMPNFVSCDSGVEGICHRDANDKSSTTFEVNFKEPGNYKLEVTVVLSNRPQGSNEWHYSSYDIEVESSTPAPVRNPSSGPSQNPSVRPSVTLFPSKNPSIESSTPSSEQTESPSIQPSNSISEAPSIAPSKSLSMSPTDSFSMSPTDSFSMNPSSIRSSAPSTVFTQVPSLSPSISNNPSSSIAPSASPSISANPSTSPVPTFSQVPTIPASNDALRLSTFSSTAILANIMILELFLLLA